MSAILQLQYCFEAARFAAVGIHFAAPLIYSPFTYVPDSYVYKFSALYVASRYDIFWLHTYVRTYIRTYRYEIYRPYQYSRPLRRPRKNSFSKKNFSPEESEMIAALVKIHKTGLYPNQNTKNANSLRNQDSRVDSRRGEVECRNECAARLGNGETGVEEY